MDVFGTGPGPERGCSENRNAFRVPYMMNSGPGSSVGIATGYGLDGQGIESLAASVI
jgi:hypothetical protein